MTLKRKSVIREGKVLEVTLRCTDWMGNRYQLWLNGELIATGSEEVVMERWNSL